MPEPTARTDGRRNQPRNVARAAALFLVLALSACSGVQSTLAPAGREAERVAGLFTALAVAGALIWMAVAAVLVYALWPGRKVHGERAASRLILWGGAIVPSVVLAVLLGYGLWLMPQIRPWADEDPTRLTVEMVGEQFWWRVTYRTDDGAVLQAANEVHLPAGERVEFVLSSPDVIHSFWIPSLAGKMDMIPGRTTRLVVEPTKPGVYRGACAEFCGPSHALMAFGVVVESRADFDRWLASGIAAAAPAAGRGQALFLANGCGACHRVAGTAATGVVGPDLTHLGARLSLGAGTLPVSRETIARFIVAPDAIKPGARMPAYPMLPRAEIEAIAEWLEGLK